MSVVFEFEVESAGNNVYYFTAKRKYKGRVDLKAKDFSCSCAAQTFKQGGKKQKDCKHVRMALALIREVRK